MLPFLFFTDGSEDGQQFAAFFIVSLYLLPAFPPGFDNYFQPVLRFAGFGFTNCYFVFKISLTPGSIGLPVIGSDRCPAFGYLDNSFITKMERSDAIILGTLVQFRHFRHFFPQALLL